MTAAERIIDPRNYLDLAGGREDIAVALQMQDEERAKQLAVAAAKRKIQANKGIFHSVVAQIVREDFDSANKPHDDHSMKQLVGYSALRGVQIGEELTRGLELPRGDWLTNSAISRGQFVRVVDEVAADFERSQDG